MKTEEKIKAYDTALKLARDYYEDKNCFKYLKGVLENIFPELQEYKDEKIRKMIINHLTQERGSLSNEDATDAIAWLEKQGQQKPIVDGIPTATNYDKWFQNCKVPKFKVGDWIANDYCFGKVIEITNDAYVLDTEQRIPFSYEHNAHIWTIQDAKPGDVLVTYDIRGNMEWLFLYRTNKHELHINDPRFYCHYDLKSDSFKKDNDYVSVALGTKFRPATKEQCDLLFQKMKEAGYEWDAEKKELRNIE